jgi:carboxypeptidase D
MQQNNNFLGFNKSFMAQIGSLDKSCGYAKYRETYLKFPPTKAQPPRYLNSTSDADCDVWTQSYLAAYAVNPCWNSYLITLQCPLQGDPLGFPSDLVYSYPGVPVYFNRTDVKKAMHAPLDREWSLCNGNPFILGEGGPQNYGDLSLDPIQKALPRVIDATKRVLVVGADLDYRSPIPGILLAIQNMTWGGQLGFQSKPSKPIVITEPDLQYDDVFVYSGFEGYDDPQGTLGVQHFERGLMYAE